MISVYIVDIPKISPAADHIHFYNGVNTLIYNMSHNFINRRNLQSKIGKLLVNFAISKQLNISGTDIYFTADTHGKPVLRDISSIHFNISHSGKYVVCAVSSETVGIDVEEIKDIDLKIADRFFTKTERDSIYNQSENDRLREFYSVWTKKESYLKMTGDRLSRPLNAFCVLDSDSLNVHFSHVILENDYICHVCSDEDSVIEINNLSIEELLSLLTKY
ncbi:hypothetical protein FACS1894219_11270 [Clostridia bacterium]|nr:hypothetical protein FACS1894219_11270 [Clostridia bacterium]